MGVDCDSSEAYAPRQIKDGTLELLKFGLLKGAIKPNLYRTIHTVATSVLASHARCSQQCLAARRDAPNFLALLLQRWHKPAREPLA